MNIRFAPKRVVNSVGIFAANMETMATVIRVTWASSHLTMDSRAARQQRNISKAYILGKS
uniref:Uncharacterized protein n=1 Tax=Romanomermis culicivorax TaxID=13658 RepID=A0A915KSY5_ROMCU